MKPMLAAKISTTQLDKIEYPVVVQPKIDGIRVLIDKGVALSRSLKPIPNLHIQKWVHRNSNYLQGIDGELVVGSPTDPKVFNSTSSGVMSIDGAPDFQLLTFDSWDVGAPFMARYHITRNRVVNFNPSVLHLVEHAMITDEGGLLRAYDSVIAKGYEGLILRDPQGYYKFGRSTLKEGKLLKLKPWLDTEATIVGFQELQHNDNEATISETGYQVRSTHQGGMVPGNKLGSFIVECVDFPGVQFSVGSGLTMHERETLWSTRNSLIGKIIKFKYLAIGIKDKPRHPIYLGFRDPKDLDMKLL